MPVTSLSERLIAALQRLGARRERAAKPAAPDASLPFNRDAFISQYWTGWGTLRARDLEALTTQPDATYLLALATGHYDGFVRQRAVELLDVHDDGSALPFLIDRLNDWVGQVRTVAQRAVLRRLTPAMAPTFRDCLPRIGRLQQQHRDDHALLIAAIQDMLSRPECRVVLDAGRDHPDSQVREECYRLLSSLSDREPAALLLSALADREPRIRLWAARTARDAVDADTLLRLWEATTREPMAAVRAALLYGLAERFSERAGPALESVLLDRSAALRGLAQFYLPRLQPGIDLAERYRNVMGEPNVDSRRLAAALLGLAETGQTEDAPYATPFVSHTSIAVRRAAFRMIARFQGVAATPALIDALGDASPSVAREGFTALLPYAGSVVIEEEAAHLLRESTSLPHTRCYALTLLAAVSKWRGLAYLLDALSDHEPTLAKTAQHLLGRWLARTNAWSAPLDPDRRAALLAAIDCAPLDDKTAQMLRLLMR